MTNRLTAEEVLRRADDIAVHEDGPASFRYAKAYGYLSEWIRMLSEESTAPAAPLAALQRDHDELAALANQLDARLRRYRDALSEVRLLAAQGTYSAVDREFATAALKKIDAALGEAA